MDDVRMAKEILRKTLRLLPLIVLVALVATLLSTTSAAAADGICIPGITAPTCTPPPTGPPGAPPANPTPPPEPSSSCGADRSSRRDLFLGVVAEDVFVGGAKYRACQLSAQAQSGVSVIRQTFRWADIELRPGRYDFHYYDDYVAALAERGITVLPILFGPPSFRSAHAAANGTYPPRKYSDMGRFAAALVRRYGPRGNFWRSHPSVPKLPIRAWQVWNEPNIPGYWPSGPNPAQYASLLKATARQIKRADRGAEIVTAGIPDSDLGIPYLKFIKGIYEAGGASSFDTLALHPYASNASGVVSTTSRVRRAMNSFGDRRARIWITEIGWATGGPPTRFTFSEQGQAGQIQRTYRKLWSARKRLRMRGAVYFAWKDSPPYSGRSDFWGYHTGLIDLNDRPKPGYYAFRSLSAALH